jgi:hypothetical protein
MWIINSSLRWTTPNMQVSQTWFTFNSKFKMRLWNYLDGTFFNKYIAILRASIHNEMGKEKLLKILLTISIRVGLCLSATLFYCGIPGMVYCAQMPCFSWRLTNGLGH